MFLDSSAVIEHFIGSSKGKRVKEILTTESCYASSISLSEIALWCYREGKNVDYFFKETKEIVDISDLSEDIYKEGARITFERKKVDKNFGLMDGLILACARSIRQKLLTRDPHFKGLDGVIIL
ncbi:MAG: PIN domain-containing protein [Methanocellales archaeon]|nr:PIN domain-containing protein [Methanocellales archaeon]